MTRAEAREYLSKALNTPPSELWELCVDEYIIHGNIMMPQIRVLQKYFAAERINKKQQQLTFEFNEL